MFVADGAAGRPGSLGIIADQRRRRTIDSTIDEAVLAQASRPVGERKGQAFTDSTFFVGSNNLAKVTPPVLRAWARILAALPEARLVLRTHALGEAAMRTRVRARLTAHGLPEDRVALEGGVPHRALLDAYGGIDIALDPFPYAGGLTVCEALWMGVPVVALAGDSFCARHALSHLSNVGLPDWVAESEEGYVALAIARARDLPALAALRAGLRARVAASPLTDAPRFGRALAATLRDAWRRWCATATPL